MSTFTALTAPGVVFESKADFTAHYKSEWHRYNLKRKTASLPMVSEAEFEARRDAAAAAAPRPKQDGHVRADKRDARQKKRALKRGVTGGNGATVSDPVPGYRQKAAARAEAEAAPEDDDDDAEPDEPEEVVAEARATDSFFDNEQFATSADAFAYMQGKYGFRVPEAAYLADPDGLAGYLCAKIKQGRTCLWCGRQFRSYRACQQHMIDKAHLKVAYETDEQVDELADFYDFSRTYEGLDEADARALAPDDDGSDGASASGDDDEGWETASTSSDGSAKGDGLLDVVEAKPAARRATRVRVLATGELLLKRGARQKIVGARWLRRYYRQNYRLEDDRDAVVAARTEARAKLLAAYARANIPATERGGYLRGIENLVNRRTVNKQLARDQRAQRRAEMLTSGFRSGGKAKDFKQNKIIKNKVAGKNMGEGLGVHG